MESSRLSKQSFEIFKPCAGKPSEPVSAESVERLILTFSTQQLCRIALETLLNQSAHNPLKTPLFTFSTQQLSSVTISPQRPPISSPAISTKISIKAPHSSLPFRQLTAPPQPHQHITSSTRPQVRSNVIKLPPQLPPPLQLRLRPSRPNPPSQDLRSLWRRHCNQPRVLLLAAGADAAAWVSVDVLCGGETSVVSFGGDGEGV
ncbi:hypothetical protein BJ508DRAFT_333193 [Ascobolus immersus RN42]|uniref:Uncharacterized protein n=1 Tax=Ascobolus immersus RN42 TaxID=1160509 RepID=A0A3N4HM23_ASCIM|nr:hypothetical protein BJ508DRAFT_333193 [Ascobolus immersus RN42]